jgi:dihydropyrimidine dehydrogenase (NAD+) subunit PreA
MSARRDLGIDFCGVHFVNPVMLSSSPVSNTGEMIGRAFDAGFGGVAYKTIGMGNIKIVHPFPRMATYDVDGKKVVGLQNVEQISDRPFDDNLADIRFLKKRWPDRIVIASIMGFSNDEWRELAIACQDAGADMLELNFSCPHMTVEGSGMKVGQAFDLVEKFTATVKKVVKIPVLAKMTPNVTDINEPALSAKRGGADGIAAINTVSGLVGIGLDDFVPRPNIFGKGAMSGYSGPAVKPIGLRCVAQMAGSPDLKLPISGIGGIETWVDTVEYLLVGASTVQITTGVIHYGYRIVEDILEGMSDFMEQHGFARVADFVGKAVPNVVHTDQFDLKRQGIASYDLDRCVGCGQCHVVCHDAGGQCLSWDSANRRPVMDEKRCLGCLICSFVCPVNHPSLITAREVPGKAEVRPPASR